MSCRNDHAVFRGLTGCTAGDVSSASTPTNNYHLQAIIVDDEETIAIWTGSARDRRQIYLAHLSRGSF
jgi:hypothetical protein